MLQLKPCPTGRAATTPAYQILLTLHYYCTCEQQNLQILQYIKEFSVLTLEKL
jgi:hypothetical protein